MSLILVTFPDGDEIRGAHLQRLVNFDVFRVTGTTNLDNSISAHGSLSFCRLFPEQVARCDVGPKGSHDQQDRVLMSVRRSQHSQESLYIWGNFGRSLNLTCDGAVVISVNYAGKRVKFDI